MNHVEPAATGETIRLTGGAAVVERALRIRAVERLISNVIDLIFRRDFNIVEVLSGMIASVSWGIILIFGPNTFSMSPSYRALADVFHGNDLPCGILFLLFGLFQLGSYFGQWHKCRVVASQMGILGWTFIGSMLLYANPLSTGWFVYLSIAAGNVWIRWRLDALNP